MNTFIIGTTGTGITQEPIFDTLFALSSHGNTNISSDYVSHLATREFKAIDSAMLTNGENTVSIREDKESGDSGL